MKIEIWTMGAYMEWDSLEEVKRTFWDWWKYILSVSNTSVFIIYTVKICTQLFSLISKIIYQNKGASPMT